MAGGDDRSLHRDDIDVSLEHGIPVWLEATELEGWPVRLVGSKELRYVVGLPLSWDTDPEEKIRLQELEHVFSGPLPTDRLAVTVLPTANPEHRLPLWVDGLVAATGFPIPSVAAPSSDESPSLLEWGPAPLPVALRSRLELDALSGYSGLGRIPGQPALLARLYVVLARRDRHAWKVALSFESACPPGTPAEVVEANDHVRAGAVLGPLQFLGPEAGDEDELGDDDM